MSKVQLVLPRVDKNGDSYISYSQLTTWKRNKRDYMRQYFFGEGFEGNAYTDFGSKVGEAIEDNDFSGFTKDEQEFLKTIPRYDEFEREIRLEMDGFYVKGFIDSNTLDSEIMTGTGVHAVRQDVVDCIMDYKTGDIEKKTSEYESESYNQLEIYALAIGQELGSTPTDAEVVLIGRGGNAFKGEKLELTQEFVVIKRKLTLESLNKVHSFVQETAEEIAKYYEVFLKMKG